MFLFLERQPLWAVPLQPFTNRKLSYRHEKQCSSGRVGVGVARRLDLTPQEKFFAYSPSHRPVATLVRWVRLVA